MKIKLFLFLLVGLFFLGFASADVTYGLKSYYYMNQTSGNLLDALGVNNLTKFGTIGYSMQGIQNLAMSSVGSGASPSANRFQDAFTGLTAGNNTIAFWFKRNANGTNADFSFYGNSLPPSSQAGMNVRNTGDTLYCGVSDSAYFGNANIHLAPNNTDWHFVACIYGRATNAIELWLDGTNRANSTWDGRSLIENQTITLFADNTGATYNSNYSMDEVGIWNRSLTVPELNELYSAGAGNTFPFTQISINLNSPANNTEFVGGFPVTFNWTSSTIVGSLVNTTLFIDGVGNETISISGTTNTTTTVKRFTVANYTWLAQTCTATTCLNSSSRNVVILRNVINSFTYTTPITEGIVNTFTANLSTNGTAVSSASLNYSGTLYSATVTGSGSSFLLSGSITSPLVNASTNYTFNWIINLADGYVLNSTFKNQTVNNLVIGNCSYYNFTLYNFTIVDETNQVQLHENNSNTYAEVDFNVYFSDGVTLLQSFSKAYNRTNSFSICFSTNISASESYILDGQVQYSADGFAKEFYNLQNENITLSDLYTNVTLYDLNSTIAQEFLVTYTDENFNPVSDALILIQRKYISEGVFKTVEIPISDDNGEAIANLVLSEIIYTFTVMKNGELLGIFENQVAFCDNVATGDCTIDLNSYASTTIPDTFANVGNYTFNIAFNQTTRVVTTSFAVASGTVTTNLLNVTLFDSSGSTQLCTDTLVSSAGTLTCTVPSNYENSTIIISLSKDGSLVGRAIISLGSTPDEIYGASRVFIAVMAFLLLIGIGVAESAVMTGIFLIIGTVLLVYLNMITSYGIIGQTATAIFFILAVIFILVKGARR